MLQNATVNKLRCAFVQATYDYFYCQTYSLDCCLDEAKDLYLKYKLTQLPCELTPDQECMLEATDVTDYTLDCQAYSPTVPCSEQLIVTSEVLTTSANFFVHLLNNFNGTAYSYYPVVSDSIAQPNSVWTILTDSPTATANGTIQVPSGYTIFDSYQLELPEAFPYFQIVLQLDPSVHNASYIKNIRLEKTDNTGMPIGFSIFDISPVSSPYLSCAGCTTITASHLYFSNAN